MAAVAMSLLNWAIPRVINIVETYELIGGECYIHGLADGQALGIAEEKGLQPTTIYIR